MSLKEVFSVIQHYASFRYNIHFEWDANIEQDFYKVLRIHPLRIPLKSKYLENSIEYWEKELWLTVASCQLAIFRYKRDMNIEKLDYYRGLLNNRSAYLTHEIVNKYRSNYENKR